ncbi:MAG: 2-methylaconitate cis-trans isomerase PrpF family protein [Alphaproteobacteria bacterium]
MTYKIPAAFIRGGTSKGVFFKADDLPPEQAARDAIFLQALGSPDPYQRQLNGMGGGLSSVSKAVIVGRSARPDADVDYTFIQVAVDRPVADYSQSCGNLSSSVGPFAVEEGLIAATDGPTTVRVYNTNTDKLYHAHFEVRDGHAVETGDFEMSGVSGTGARVRLDYLHPGGARTAAFLPTGKAAEPLRLPDGKAVQASLVDATSPVVFVAAEDMGVSGIEAPEALEADTRLMTALESLRRAAGVAMGMAETPEAVALSSPKIALVAPPRGYRTIGGEAVAAGDYDIAVRIVSMERMHRAVTGTGGMCLAAACQVTGSVPNRIARPLPPGQDIRIGTPSGAMTVAANVRQDDTGRWQVDSVTVYRTQRRLMEGKVVLPRG